jgi:hypothetical protein
MIQTSTVSMWDHHNRLAIESLRGIRDSFKVEWDSIEEDRWSWREESHYSATLGKSVWVEGKGHARMRIYAPQALIDETGDTLKKFIKDSVESALDDATFDDLRGEKNYNSSIYELDERDGFRIKLLENIRFRKIGKSDYYLVAFDYEIDGTKEFLKGNAR